MYDLEKADKRNDLIRAMSKMSKVELARLEPCDQRCPPWKLNGCGCSVCHDSMGWYTPEEFSDLPENVIVILNRPRGALGPNGCEIDRQGRSIACLRELCNPFMRVAGVDYG